MFQEKEAWIGIRYGFAKRRRKNTNHVLVAETRVCVVYVLYDGLHRRSRYTKKDVRRDEEAVSKSVEREEIITRRHKANTQDDIHTRKASGYINVAWCMSAERTVCAAICSPSSFLFSQTDGRRTGTDCWVFHLSMTIDTFCGRAWVAMVVGNEMLIWVKCVGVCRCVDVCMCAQNSKSRPTSF